MNSYSWLAEYMSPTATAHDAVTFAEHLQRCGWQVPVRRPGILGPNAIVNETGESISDHDWEYEMMVWSCATVERDN